MSGHDTDDRPHRHGAFYIADKPPLRTATIAAGVLCALGLFLAGGRVIG
jgi:hypothetical protein